MSQVLTKTKFVSWVHLEPVTIKPPHIPFCTEYFKANLTGFEQHSLKNAISWFGYRRYGLVDISGLLPEETEERIKRDHAYSRVKVDVMTFLQSLDWIKSGHRETRFNFTYIVAYTTARDDPMVARPTDDGFLSIPHPNEESWPAGTLCLFLPGDL